MIGDSCASTNNEPRVNERIRAREVRLIGPDGEQLGIRPLPEALAIARELDLDLVEVADKANPPVCRIMDYGKYKYEAAQRAKESRKKASNISVKEMKYRPKIGTGDFDTKTRKVEEFLGEGHKVKVTIMFRGREMQHPELGRQILDHVAEAVSHVALVEVYPEAGWPQHGDGARARQEGAGGTAEATRGREGRGRHRSPGRQDGDSRGRSEQPSTAGRRHTPTDVNGRSRAAATHARRTRLPWRAAQSDAAEPEERNRSMPKMKTHSGAKKRFKITGTGKLRRRKPAT